jgi:signal transduction histidine kinase
VAGTGFGLAIAQQYAGQHDGQITLLPSSEGAHFQLTIRKRIA